MSRYHHTKMAWVEFRIERNDSKWVPYEIELLDSSDVREGVDLADEIGCIECEQYELPPLIYLLAPGSCAYVRAEIWVAYWRDYWGEHDSHAEFRRMETSLLPFPPIDHAEENLRAVLASSGPVEITPEQKEMVINLTGYKES